MNSSSSPEDSWSIFSLKLKTVEDAASGCRGIANGAKVPGDSLVDLLNFFQALQDSGAMQQAIVVIFNPEAVQNRVSA